VVDDKINNDIKIHLHCGPFQRLCGCAGAIGSTLPNAACPGLYQKLLNTAIGQLLATYCPSSRQGNSKKTTTKTYTYFAGHFDGHGDAPVRYSAHCPMEEVQGFTRSNWMPPLGKYYVR
jgi:hypothetical protein